MRFCKFSYNLKPEILLYLKNNPKSKVLSKVKEPPNIARN